MYNLLKWVDQVAPADQRKLDQLNKAGLLNALQLVRRTKGGRGGNGCFAVHFRWECEEEEGMDALLRIGGGNVRGRGRDGCWG